MTGKRGPQFVARAVESGADPSRGASEPGSGLGAGAAFVIAKQHKLPPLGGKPRERSQNVPRTFSLEWQRRRLFFLAAAMLRIAFELAQPALLALAPGASQLPCDRTQPGAEVRADPETTEILPREDKRIAREILSEVCHRSVAQRHTHHFGTMAIHQRCECLRIARLRAKDFRIFGCELIAADPVSLKVHHDSSVWFRFVKFMAEWPGLE